MVEALLEHGAGLADLFGVVDAVFPGWSPFVRGVEERGAGHAPAGCGELPVPVGEFGPGNRRVSATVGLSILRKNPPRSAGSGREDALAEPFFFGDDFVDPFRGGRWRARRG